MMDSGFLLFDGASHRQALVWLCQRFPEHSPRPLLQGTPYEPLAAIGPILLQADAGTPLNDAWQAGQPELEQAVWLRSELPLVALRESLRRRLRILAPDGRVFWLRLADARPLRQAWRSQVQWPAGFWHGVSEVWLRDGEAPILAWHNPHPQLDATQPGPPLEAQITLDWPLLDALAQPEPHPQDAPA